MDELTTPVDDPKSNAFIRVRRHVGTVSRVGELDQKNVFSPGHSILLDWQGRKLSQGRKEPLIQMAHQVLQAPQLLARMRLRAQLL